jgi:hypothetical protein
MSGISGVPKTDETASGAEADAQAFCQTSVFLAKSADEDQMSLIAGIGTQQPSKPPGPAGASQPAHMPNVSQPAQKPAKPNAQPNVSQPVQQTAKSTVHPSAPRPGQQTLQPLAHANLPPALFSRSSHKSSCDGAAARNLTYMVLGTSKEWWLMGLVLIGASVTIGFGDWLSMQIEK